MYSHERTDLRCLREVSIVFSAPQNNPGNQVGSFVDNGPAYKEGWRWYYMMLE
jgi:hypothetical protein